MENRYFLKECKLVPTEGSSLKQEFEISAGNPLISYYESIKSPAISLTLTFLDVDQLVSREGITGGEYLSLKVKKEGHDDFEIKADKHFLMLNSVKDVSTSSSKQVATLEFVSVEAIINETARVNKKYTGNVTQTVKELLKGRRGIETKKNLDSDRASNSYSFVGNLKRPFDTIQWLCPKTQSSKESFGFLFFETLDGYKFKSIKKLLDQKPAYTYTQTDKPNDDKADGLVILQNRLNQTNDIGMNLRMGMYANKTIYIDIENQTKQIVDFKISDLKPKKPLKLLNGIENNPTRLMLRVNDLGSQQKGSKKKDVEKLNELAVYQNKSYIRNNLLFSQSLSISIPLNPELRAGQVLNLKFPLKKGDGEKETDSYGSDKTNDPSGKYLISELRHLIGGGKGETQLTLIRDTFTA